MSGGTYDYIHYDLATASDKIRRNKSDKRRMSFCKLLHLICEALHKIDLVDSDDMGDGDEFEAIDNVFKFLNINPEDRYKIDFYDDLEKRLLRVNKFYGEK